MDYCDHCNTDITNADWFYAKECDSAPDSRVCKACNITFLRHCQEDLEYGEYLDAEEEYREMEGETYELSTQYFRNLTGKEYIEDFQDQVLYDQLFKIAAPIICIRYAK